MENTSNSRSGLTEQIKNSVIDTLHKDSGDKPENNSENSIDTSEEKSVNYQNKIARKLENKLKRLIMQLEVVKSLDLDSLVHETWDDYKRGESIKFTGSERSDLSEIKRFEKIKILSSKPVRQFLEQTFINGEQPSLEKKKPLNESLASSQQNVPSSDEDSCHNENSPKEDFNMKVKEKLDSFSNSVFIESLSKRQYIRKRQNEAKINDTNRIKKRKLDISKSLTDRKKKNRPGQRERRR